MENNVCKKVVFADGIDGLAASCGVCDIVHILCLRGGMSFVFQEVSYNVTGGDYVILPNVSLASGFSASPDFESVVMCLSESYVASMAIRSDYGMIGHLALLRNPVMKLSRHDFDVCLDGMSRIRERLSDTGHLFFWDMIGSLLTAHILDLYDIHARSNGSMHVSERTAGLLGRFIGLLYSGEYMAHRDLGYYASRLCVTPHYLSEVCRKACGRPASYWIERFTVNGIMRMLSGKELSLTDIAGRFNFSSLSYFSRYVQKRIGMSPSDYRNEVFSGRRG